MRFIDLTGETFGRLLVIERAGRRGRDVLWRCLCECGGRKLVISPSLRRGLTRSCGCLEDESRRRRALRRSPIVDGDTIRIRLTRGLVAVIDRDDADLASENWTALRADTTWYACRNLPAPDKRMILLHREVARRAGMAIDGLEVDHRDGDGMNCRRTNLRPATSAQNKHNQGPRASLSGIKGVRWFGRLRKWQARIDGRHLGYFRTKEAARAVYASAAVLRYGEFARIT